MKQPQQHAPSGFKVANDIVRAEQRLKRGKPAQDAITGEALAQPLQHLRGRGTAHIVERDGLRYLALTLDGMAIMVDAKAIAWMEQALRTFQNARPLTIASQNSFRVAAQLPPVQKGGDE